VQGIVSVNLENWAAHERALARGKPPSWDEILPADMYVTKNHNIQGAGGRPAQWQQGTAFALCRLASAASHAVGARMPPARACAPGR
jgi:hypothetical protein